MRWQALIGLVVIGLFSWAGFRLWRPPDVVQPIQFPHKTHVDLNLECTSCHERAEKDSVAGRPPTALCLSCHGGGDDKGEIQKVRAYEKGGEIPWRRVWRLPRHVFFPHRTHVVFAKLKCQTCHGPMETLTKPPARPLKTLTMDDCIGCHQKTAALASGTARAVASGTRPLSTDCTACHR